MYDFEKFVGRAAQFEQLAEEAAELGQAALKQARVLRGENPTPVTNEEAYAKVIEEFTDVIIVGRSLNLFVDEKQIKRKHERWMNRINEKEGNK